MGLAGFCPAHVYREQEALIELLLDKAETAYWANAPVCRDRSRNVTSKCRAGRKRHGKEGGNRKERWERVMWRVPRWNTRGRGKHLVCSELSRNSLHGHLVVPVSCFLMLGGNLEAGAADAGAPSYWWRRCFSQLFTPHHLSIVSESFTSLSDFTKWLSLNHFLLKCFAYLNKCRKLEKNADVKRKQTHLCIFLNL